MPSKTFRYAAIALGVLKKVLGSNFSVTGIEKLPNQPVMFVANHFTRAETFFVPYLIFKNTGRPVRCLADSSLYQGSLGRFLESIGAISTKDKNRDKIILKDLITGDYDWMIYPEGSMIKSKETKKGRKFINHTPHRTGPVRTGSAILALKSQIYRDNFNKAAQNNDKEDLQQLEKEFDITYEDSFKDISTQIVPVNITYYPLRPGENKIKKIAEKLIKRIPKEVTEELEIEGNLLLGAEININFGDPIDLKTYIKSACDIIYSMPLIKRKTKTNLVLKYFRSRLTYNFMSKIYSDIQVNFDHIFSASLGFLKETEVELSHLKRVIYLSGVMIQECGKYRLNNSIFEDRLFRMFLDEPHAEFDGVLQLAKDQGVVKELSNGKIRIKKSLLKKEYGFHQIRLENSLYVIANEFSLLDVASDIVKRNSSITDKKLCKKVFNQIHLHDLKNFNSDYKDYFDKDFSKEESIGAPFFLDSKEESVEDRVGVLISHGYKSAPKEVEALSKFLNNLGFKVYAVRLKGHGTAPINLKDVTYQDWQDSLERGYAALQNISTKIIVVGFSTGALLGLLLAANKSLYSNKIAAIITINAALRLQDIRARMVPGINIWNDLLEKMSIEKGKFEYVDDVPENPLINYSRNYLKGVEELRDLMDLCEKELSKVYSPILVIQAENDPVVNQISGKIIYGKVSSKNKFLEKMDFSNHVIINSERKEEVFEIIENFLSKIKLI